MTSDSEKASGPRQIKSVVTATAILEAIQGRNGATLTEITENLELTKGTVHTYLRTLENCGFVTNERGIYRLGLQFITIGEYVRNELAIYRAGQEEVSTLAERTGEYAHLVVEDDGREVAVFESRGEYAVATDYHLRMRETPQHLHDSAAGKTILAHLPEERIEEVLAETGFEPKTANTVTDPDELRSELDTVRERGYAVNDEEEIRGMRAVGAPILTRDGGIVGAVSVTAPTSRLKGERFRDEVPEMVIETANLIEVNLETAQFDRRPGVSID